MTCDERTVEVMARALHSYRVGEWKRVGVTSRTAPSGEEYMLPWYELGEAAREFDRQGIRAALKAAEGLK